MFIIIVVVVADSDSTFFASTTSRIFVILFGTLPLQVCDRWDGHSLLTSCHEQHEPILLEGLSRRISNPESGEQGVHEWFKTFRHTAQNTMTYALHIASYLRRIILFVDTWSCRMSWFKGKSKFRERILQFILPENTWNMSPLVQISTEDRLALILSTKKFQSRTYRSRLDMVMVFRDGA